MGGEGRVQLGCVCVCVCGRDSKLRIRVDEYIYIYIYECLDRKRVLHIENNSNNKLRKVERERRILDKYVDKESELN